MSKRLNPDQYLDCYIRVSTKSQEDNQSLKTQEESGKKVSKKLGLVFRLRNEKSHSSTIGVREVLENLKSDIEKGKVKNVWCSERSRMFRDETDSSLFRRDYLQEHDVKLFEGIEGNQCNFDNLEEKLSFDIVSKIQQYENEKRSFKSQQGKRYLLSKQLKNRHYGGTVQFGYKVVDKFLQLEETESEYVLYMFKSILDGKSVTDIKTYLDLNGVKSRRTKSGLWSIGTIQKILNNKSYYGVKTFKDIKLKKTFEYRIDPIISLSTFNKVRDEMKRRHKLQDNNKKHFSIFDDIKFVCECSTNIGSMVKKGTRKNGKTFDTQTYYCQTTQRNWKSTSKKLIDCKNSKSMNIKETDEVILDLIKETVSNSNILKDRFKKDVLISKFENDKSTKKELVRLEEKHTSIVKGIERTYKNLVSCETDLIQERKDKKLLKGIIDSLKVELEESQKSLIKVEHDIDDVNNKTEWINWIQKYSDDLDLKTQDTDSRKDFVKGLVKKIVVKSHYDSDRDGKNVQIGHSFDIHFKMKVVNDKLVYEDQSNKNKGYELIEGKDKLSSTSFSLRKSRGSVKKKS